MKFPSLVFGWVLYAAVLLLCFAYNGGHFESLLHPGELFGVAVAPLACLGTAYGFGGTLRHLRAAFGKNSPFDAAETERFLSLWISSAYGTGFILFILGLIITGGFVAGDPAKIAEKVASAMVAPLWAAFLAEGLLRPLRHRIAAGK